jgi:hypothetical protein
MTDRLLAPNAAYLTPGLVVNRLKSVFPYVEVDGQEGRRHVIETVERLNIDTSIGFIDPHVVALLMRGKERALFVCFGDNASSDLEILDTYVVPAMPMVFEYASAEHESTARPLLMRCAVVLGYEILKDRRALSDPTYSGRERRSLLRERRRFSERRSGYRNPKIPFV